MALPRPNPIEAPFAFYRGQRWMQPALAIFLGWVTSPNGRSARRKDQGRAVRPTAPTRNGRKSGITKSVDSPAAVLRRLPRHITEICSNLVFLCYHVYSLQRSPIVIFFLVRPLGQFDLLVRNLLVRNETQDV